MAAEQINSTITTGGTAKTVIAADGSREQITIQNNSAEDMWCNFLGTAAIDTGWKLSAGVSRTMRKADWPQIANALSIVAATTGSKYSIHTDVN